MTNKAVHHHLIMQRLHEDDLVGHVLEQETWEHVRLPAIAEQEEIHLVESPLGSRWVSRHVGEALHPEREPLPSSTISAALSANTISRGSTNNNQRRSAAVW